MGLDLRVEKKELNNKPNPEAGPVINLARNQVMVTIYLFRTIS
jgi:hypothetical protein